MSNTLKASFNSSSASFSCNYKTKINKKRTVSISPFLFFSFLIERKEHKTGKKMFVKIKMSLSDFSLLLYLHFPCHEIQELPKFYGSITINIHFIDHAFQFFLCRILIQRSDCNGQFFNGDAAYRFMNRVYSMRKDA